MTDREALLAAIRVDADDDRSAYVGDVVELSADGESALVRVGSRFLKESR